MPPRRSARGAAAAVAAASAAPTPAPAALPQRSSPSPAPTPAPNLLPLKSLRVSVLGAFPGQTTEDVLTKAKDLGAATTINLTKTVTHLITSQSEYNHDSTKIKKAKAQGVHLISVDWLSACEKDGKKVNEAPFLLSNATATAPTSAAAPAANGTAKKGKKRAASPDSGSDTKPTVPAAKKSKNAAAAAASAASAVVSSKLQKKADTAGLSNGQLAKKKKGFHVPVDEMCNLSNTGYAVYIDAENIIYDGNLNQTNASHNNNKFYRVQLLHNPKSNDFKCWTRWGRVGEMGQSGLLGDGTLASAMVMYERKFKDKSGLKWANRLDAPKAGKYTFIERNYDEDDSDAEDKDEDGVKEEEDEDEYIPPESKLEAELQDLMALIFNKTYLDNSMHALNYDANKLPLGKLSKSTILKGFQALKDLASLFDDNSLAQTVHSLPYGDAVERLSNRFYSIIPHAFGRNRPPIIATEAMLKREIELLESLGDMKEAAAIMKANRPRDTIHQFDRQYAGLNMEEMSILDKSSAEFTNLAQYLTETKAQTHNINYKVEEIFRIERKGEKARFEESVYAKVPSDRRLLWHGSRTTNFGGILSQGLRIAPPEAPVSGYMFGKGIYLADMSSKSANYCCAYNSGGTALLLLCEAELGAPMQELTQASYNAGDEAKQKGLHSTWGKGTTGPSAWKDAECVHPSLKGIRIPDVQAAKPGATGVSGATLMYNEYIAYDVQQVRLRYLFRVKM